MSVQAIEACPFLYENERIRRLDRRMVREMLEKDEWEVRDLPIERGQRRPDYAAVKNGKDCRIVPVFATDIDSKLLSAARERLLGLRPVRFSRTASWCSRLRLKHMSTRAALPEL